MAKIDKLIQRMFIALYETHGCLTTIEIEGMTQPLNYDDKNSLNVPRIFWDKYRLENNRYVMLVNFTVSHVLMDGEDLAKALNLLKNYSLDFRKIIE